MTSGGKSYVEGRYEHLGQLGLGGVSAVFKVYDRIERRVCALKLLSRHIYRTEEGAERLRREADAMMMIDHDGVAKLYALHEDPPAIAMELVKGKALTAWQLKNGAMSAQYVLRIAIQVAEALNAIHAAGMIHRDIKLGNILVTPEGKCKLVDFGLARMESSSSITQTGIMMGTYGFIAPEQIDDAKRVDHRADIYSLGICLLSLLVGDPPNLDMQLLVKASDHASADFCRLLMQMTLENPDLRIQEMSEVIRRLNALSDPGPELSDLGKLDTQD